MDLISRKVATGPKNYCLARENIWGQWGGLQNREKLKRTDTKTNKKEIQRLILKVDWLWLNVKDTETLKYTHTQGFY